MKTRRGNIAVGLITMAFLGLTGCAGGGGPADIPAAVASTLGADARQAFNTATENLSRQPVRFETVTVGWITANGRLDPGNQKAEFSGRFFFPAEVMDIHFISIGDDVWLKIEGISESEKWMHTTADKVRGTSLDLADPDNPGGIMTMINAVNHVEHDGANGFKGTIDMTKSPTMTEMALAALGDKVRAVPFTAKVGDAGNLRRFVIDMGQFSPGLKMALTYSEYGVPVEVQAPPSDEVIEMPGNVLAALMA